MPPTGRWAENNRSRPVRQHHILIAGGGIGGMAAALALLNRGHDVDVYEQAPELKEFGAGVQISPNGTRALHALGVLAQLRQLSCETSGKEVRLWNTGRTWKLFDLGTEAIARYGFPYVTVFRPDLLQVLVDAVRARKPDAIHLGRRAVGFTQQDGRATLRLDGGESVTGDALIGADGVHSVIRHALFGGDRPRFFGMIAWRGVIPIELVPAHISRDKATNWIGVGGHVVHYPLRAGKLMNFVGIQERADWQVEVVDDTRHGARMRQRPQRLARRCAGLDTRGAKPVQMGADGARSAAAMDARSRDAARRCLPSDLADVGAGRRHGDRGCRRPGPVL